MLLVIAKKEFLSNISSVRYLLALLVCIVFVTSSLVLGGYQYKDQLRVEKGYDSSFEDLPSFLGGQSKLYVDRPPSPLLMFGSGLNAIVGQHFVLREEFGKVPELRPDHRIIEPEGLFGVFGRFDFEQVVVVLLSLLALVFAYDTISGEKQRGTLALILSNAVPRDTLILGKILGGYFALLIPFVVSMMLGMVTADIFFGLSLTWAHAIRIGAIFLLSALYILLFFLIGMFISARTSTSSSSLILCLLCWVVLVLVVPGMSSMVAQKLKSVSSPGALQTKKSLVEREMGKELDVVVKRMLQNKKRPDKRDEASLMKMLKDSRTEVAHKKRKIDAEYRREVAAQLEVARWISRITPASSYGFALSALNETGWSDQVRFLSHIQQAEKDLKPVHAVRTSLSESLADGLTDIVSLVLFLVLFFLGAYVSFIRYGVS